MLIIKSGGIDYKFGTITSFSDSFSKSVSVTPIVSLPTDCAFPLETGASLTYEVAFTRKSPKDYDDSSDDSDMWCNATWMERVSTLPNRWQMRTDGYEMIFEELDENGNPNPYAPYRRERVYIKKLSFTSDSGYTDIIRGSMQLKVGSARSSTKMPAPIDQKYDVPKESRIAMEDSYVLITSPMQDVVYPLQYGAVFKGAKDYDLDTIYSVDCLNSYTVTGGPSTPFECIQLEVSRKKLTELYPELGEAADATFSKDIVAGMSQIRFRGMGEGTMIVSNCKMTSGEYVITAYCRAEKYRAQTLDMIFSGTPLQCIKDMLTGGWGALFKENQLVIHISRDIQNEVAFKTTVTYWQALQVCAGLLNAKIFFANDKAYIIDYSLGPNLFDNLEIFPIHTEDSMYGRVVGQASYGNEGQDTIVNVQTVICGKDGEGNPIVRAVKDDPSVKSYSYKEGQAIDVTKFAEETDDMPDTFINLCDHIVQYASEPQKSIAFEVKEQSSEDGLGAWTPVFPTCMCINKLSSSMDGISISNNTTATRLGTGDKRRPQKLYLSEYERQYPEMLTKYTFGVISNIDLQSTISKIQKG